MPIWNPSGKGQSGTRPEWQQKLECELCRGHSMVPIPSEQRWPKAINNPLTYFAVTNEKTSLCITTHGIQLLEFSPSPLYHLLCGSLNGSMDISVIPPPRAGLSCPNTAAYELLLLTEGSLVIISPLIFRTGLGLI
uniref:Uncharacterized protein n=1 Tax=Xenopus tropicalis TaxID=8364 RepID=A0A1B8Y162_XENTR